MSSRAKALAARWLGLGLASVLAVLTLGLWLTGRLALYVNPDGAWFAIAMAIVLLVGALLSFLLPLGDEEDHDHDDEHVHVRTRWSGLLAVTGGILASVVIVGALVLPPASLSPQLAMERDLGAPPLFGGVDAVRLASTADTSTFGIGEWATVFATATDPRVFEGQTVELTGFLTPGDTPGASRLSRLVITHCVIDAQVAGVPVTPQQAGYAAGTWVKVTGVVQQDGSGRLIVSAHQVTQIPEPADPYEY